MLYSVVTNAPFVGRVEKGVETSVYITEFAVIRILGMWCALQIERPPPSERPTTPSETSEPKDS